MPLYQKATAKADERERKMEKRKTILLGVKNNQIITADISLRDWNGYDEFSASFNVGEAFNVDSIDDNYKKEYADEYWSSLDDTSKLNLLQDGEITKDEVLKNIIEDSYYGDYHDFIDCSCTDYELDKDGKIINFQSNSVGQHDIREDYDFEDMRFTDEKLFNDIMYFWDNFHLKEVNDEQIEEIKKIMDSQFEEYTNEFDKFIVNNIDWVVL